MIVRRLLVLFTILRCIYGNFSVKYEKLEKKLTASENGAKADVITDSEKGLKQFIYLRNL